MKKILGLDLGTNSIGWALIQNNFEEKKGEIIDLGSRIIPMSQDVLSDFNTGTSKSQTAERTRLRSTRRLRERHLLRRERLHRILKILNCLPDHYSQDIDWQNHFGKLLPKSEPKLAYQNGNFIFQNSFNDMMVDFKKSQPELVSEGKKIPYDWTIYYLRKKALNHKIEKNELAWILLNFNQKRGYYQLRGEDEDDNPSKLVEFYSLKVKNVTADTDQKSNKDIWYNIELENGWIYRRSSKITLIDWAGHKKDFIVTTELNSDGSIKKDKEGKEKRSFKAVDVESDWIAIKKSTEQKLEKSNKTVGAFIYDSLLNDPGQKIKGKLVRVIERKFYKKELSLILNKQAEFHNELTSKEFLEKCVKELYQNNIPHFNSSLNNSLSDFILNDVIFYQRPLKSKKSLIADCKFEAYYFKKDGAINKIPLKCIPKSNPLFQEFRIWNWISNLQIFDREIEQPITQNHLKSETDITNLYEFLNVRKEISQKKLLEYFNLTEKKYRWNFPEEKVYPCNETRSEFIKRFEKCITSPEAFLSKKNETELWHILYSVNDKIELSKALNTFKNKNSLNDNFVDLFLKFPPFKNEYGSYSEKAIKKLLSVIRTGSFWKKDEIHTETLNRIDKIINGEYDIKVQDREREKLKNLLQIEDFRGLPLHLASYTVFGRFSEDGDTSKWLTSDELDKYINEFKQHSLRNPIVEQVILECLRVVRDIWNTYGKGEENFFDEIHIELGREMKNPNDKRANITKKIAENENTNLRIKALLAELATDKNFQNVRPYSPSQQELLKIFEEGILNSSIDIPDDINKISKTAQPTSSDLNRYKLWLEQKYRSPYTGQMIPLSKLFTPAYEIEHIIPQSRYFDDSFGNKVICETEVNKDKDNSLGLEYILNNSGKKIQLNEGKFITLFTVEEFQNFVKENYSKNRIKMKNLLLSEIPDKMIERQLNDTRYISKVVKNLLSKIVRNENKDDGVTSTNVISSNGQITSTLKKDWGLENVWNAIVAPRFIRLNLMTNTSNYGKINENTHKFLPTVPLEESRGFNKKRIDHRHHALDALVIACVTRDHVNYLNNQSAKNEKARYDLQKKLRKTERIEVKSKMDGSNRIINVSKEFFKPWDSFTNDAKNKILETLVSFKQNIRVINKTINYYEKMIGGKKIKLKQVKGENWAIRKSLHKDTVTSKVNLKKKKIVSLVDAIDNPSFIVDKSLKKQILKLAKEGMDKKKILNYFNTLEKKWQGIDVSRVELYYWDNENYASRIKLDTSFSEKIIEKVTDQSIKNILLRHLKSKNNEPEIAFSPEGIEEMNSNIQTLNNGKKHLPIYKVRTYEYAKNKFPIGHLGNKGLKYVEADKGTNLFFGIYSDSSGKRSYSSIPLIEVIERMKQKLSPVNEVNTNGDKLLFHLSPNDLVYVPTEDEMNDPHLVNFKSPTEDQINRIYKNVSFSGTQCFFIRNEISTSIVDKFEFSPSNKMEKTIDGVQIKAVCWKLKVNRLGKIEKVFY